MRSILIENNSELDDIDALAVIREIITGASKPETLIEIFGKRVTVKRHPQLRKYVIEDYQHGKARFSRGPRN